MNIKPIAIAIIIIACLIAAALKVNEVIILILGCFSIITIDEM